MSFDLYVWHEDQPITAEDAYAKLEAWDDDETPDPFKPHPSVGRFCDALLERFPALESLSDDDLDRLGVWSVTPDHSDTMVPLSCVWSRAGEVYATVQALAVEHGLVCYEPGHHVLNPNAPGYDPPFTLSSESLPTILDPDERRLEWMIGKVGRDNRHVTLERRDGWFVQVGYGEAAGVRQGTYALEYQEGSPDRHFRCQTTDGHEALRLLKEFRSGDETWKRRHPWQPL
jgi:hypothetical protein